MQKSNIARNLSMLRQRNRLSQEEVAGRIGVSRQSMAKWEAGESTPYIVNCDALARLYDVELNDLVRYDPDRAGMGIAPKGKHIFRQIVDRENCLILFSTHITSDLDRCADDITYIRNGRVLQSADREAFLRSFEHLKTPQDATALTLEEIMLRTERSDWEGDASL